MKKNVIKMAFAAVCVVAAGVSGMKAYNVANQSEADMLFAENVEALSAGDYRETCNSHCTYCSGDRCCFDNGNSYYACLDMKSN